MTILANFSKILAKFHKKEEKPQINLEIIENPELDVEPNPNILIQNKHIRTPFSHYIKKFLRWLDLKNQIDEEGRTALSKLDPYKSGRENCPYFFR